MSSYVLFSIGNLTPLFQATWGACWDTGAVCNPQWVAAVTYLEILGIIVGQVLVGFVGDGYGTHFVIAIPFPLPVSLTVL